MTKRFTVTMTAAFEMMAEDEETAKQTVLSSLTSSSGAVVVTVQEDPALLGATCALAAAWDPEFMHRVPEEEQTRLDALRLKADAPSPSGSAGSPASVLPRACDQSSF